MAIEHYRHHPPKPKPDGFDAEFVAIVRILLVVGGLAVLLGLLNHFV
jgi:hypothetical protein